MISRHWRGIARTDDADRYVAHLRTETLPELSRLPGFLGASILRRPAAEGVEFMIVTRWESMDAIRRFAGDDPSVAVVPDKVQEMMRTFERAVDHYEVVE